MGVCDKCGVDDKWMWEVKIREAGQEEGWGFWARTPLGYKVANIELIKVDLGKVVDDYWTDSFGQGYSAETSLIFKVWAVEGDRFFQKKGTQDSYGDILWENGAFDEVKMKRREVSVWEPQ